MLMLVVATFVCAMWGVTLSALSALSYFYRVDQVLRFLDMGTSPKVFLRRLVSLTYLTK
jgi:hypothetical protein